MNKKADGKEKVTMPVLMKGFALVFLAGTVLFALLYGKTAAGIWLSLAITCGTFAYHLGMRLLTGLAFRTVMRNRADYRKRWYRVLPRERALYERLGVKRWKKRLPSYDASLFDPRLHTWEEIAQAMCQAELVHEIIVVLSFLPIAAGRWFGAFPVFILTSVLAAAVDLTFVILQRYNRQRVLRILDRKQ